MWSKTKTHPSLINKSTEIKEIFALAANVALSKGRSEEESVYAGLACVRSHENKNIPKSVEKSSIPVSKTKEVKMDTPKEPLVKSTKFVSATWDNQGRLTLVQNNGEKLTTPPIPIARNLEQNIVVETNPIFDFIRMSTTANVLPEQRVPGMLTWNEVEDCLDIVQEDGSTLQVGLENYIQVINPGIITLENGKVVGFVGVSDETPLVGYVSASPTGEPLRTIGILTNDLPPGQTGRATVFGKVRGLNTTGSSVGETWAPGNTLWVHPTIPGEVTIVRPGAPYPSMSVGVVLKVHATEGVLGIRPVIYPRLYYGTFVSTQEQTPAVINTPYAVSYNVTEFSSGISVQNSTELLVDSAGLYSFDFSLQIMSTSASAKTVYVWSRINGVNIPDTTSKLSVVGNNVDYVLSLGLTHLMQAGDYFQLMWASDSTSVALDINAPVAFAPGIPSVIMKATKFDL